MKRWICSTLACAGIFAITTAAIAGDEKKAGMTMDPAAQQAMMAAGALGEHHAHIKKLTGNFDYTMKMWMDPSAPPMEMTGKRSAELLLGGRYLQEKYTGVFNEMPFEGVGTLGYDNLGKQYVSTWMDNMSTGIMVSHGQCSKDGWAMSGESPDPMTGKMVTMRSLTRMPDENTIVMEMWGPGPDGKEFKSMEMTCKRVK